MVFKLLSPNITFLIRMPKIKIIDFLDLNDNVVKSQLLEKIKFY